MFFSVPTQICQLLRFHKMDIRSLEESSSHPATSQKKLRCCIWYPHGAVDPEAIWGTAPVGLEVGRCQFGIPVSLGLSDLMVAGLSENLEVRGMQRKIEMMCLFREESDGGGGVMFSKVSVKIRTFDSIFLEHKRFNVFSPNKVSKKQKSMAFLKMPCFWGVLFLNIKFPGKSFPHPPPKKIPWKKTNRFLPPPKNGPPRRRPEGCQPGSLQGGFHSHWELCSDVSLCFTFGRRKAASQKRWGNIWMLEEKVGLWWINLESQVPIFFLYVGC